MARLTGILGVVCRRCDAYNEPGARTCGGCGQPLGTRSAPAASSAAGEAGAGPAAGSDPAGQRAGGGGPPPPAGGRGTLLLAAEALASVQRMANRLFAAGRARGARLALERGSGPEGATFRLEEGEWAAGRAEGPLAFPADPYLAPLQATFLLRNGALSVRDEGAPGGVFLRVRGRCALRPGDEFALGDHRLRYRGLLPPSPPPGPDGTRRGGSPRPPEPALLIEERLEGGLPGRVHLIAGPSVTIGRAGCAVNLADDPWLSLAHAEVAVAPDGGAELRDLGSAHGTFARLPERAERRLEDGDVVRLGRQVLRVFLS